MNARDHKIINTLWKIAKISATLPSKKPSRLFNIYQILMITFSLFLSVFSIYNGAILVYGKINSIDFFINLLSQIIYAMMGLVMLFHPLKSPQKWRKLYANLVRNRISKKPTTNCNISAFIETLTLCVIWFCRATYSIWVWFPITGLIPCALHIYRHLNDFYSLMLIALLVHVNVVIKKRFFFINQMLKRADNIRQVQKLYRETVGMIEMFSNAFGYQIMFIVATVIVVILESSNNFLYNRSHIQNENKRVIVWSISCGLNVMVT